MANGGLEGKDARNDDFGLSLVGSPSYHAQLFAWLSNALPVLKDELKRVPEEAIEVLLGSFDDWSDGRGNVARAWGARLLSAGQRQQGCPLLEEYIREQNALALPEHIGCDDAGEEGLHRATEQLLEPIVNKLAELKGLEPLHSAANPACAPWHAPSPAMCVCEVLACGCRFNLPHVGTDGPYRRRDAVGMAGALPPLAVPRMLPGPSQRGG